MIFWVLPISEIPIPRSTIIRLEPEELDNVNVKPILDSYTATITSKIDNVSNYLVPLDKQSSRVRKIEAVLDLWDGDINMIPYEPTSEESTMEQLD